MTRFKKSDLRQGDIIVTKDASIGMLLGITFIIPEGVDSSCSLAVADLNSYDNELKHKEFKEFDILEVYRFKPVAINFSERSSVSNILRNLDADYIELIWKEEPEIDWSKVPKFTKVQVRDSIDSKWMNRYYIGVVKNDMYPYIASLTDSFTYDEFNDNETYKYIKLYDKTEIKEEWYK